MWLQIRRLTRGRSYAMPSNTSFNNLSPQEQVLPLWIWPPNTTFEAWTNTFYKSAFLGICRHCLQVNFCANYSNGGDRPTAPPPLPAACPASGRYECIWLRSPTMAKINFVKIQLTLYCVIKDDANVPFQFYNLNYLFRSTPHTLLYTYTTTC